MGKFTKRLLKKLDNYIPGASIFLDPKNFDLDWSEEALLELASFLISRSEKGKKLAKSAKKGKKASKRRNFPPRIKKLVLIQQNFRCNHCHQFLEYPEFDHSDRDSSNNDISNCQALCPNCHARKSRNIKHRRLKLSKALGGLRKKLR